MLSKLIDWAYFELRYAIWGPEVSFVDGTVIPEGRPPEDRTGVTSDVVKRIYDQVREEEIPTPFASTSKVVK